MKKTITYEKEFQYIFSDGKEKENQEDKTILKEIQEKYLFRDGRVYSDENWKITLEENKETERKGGIGFDGEFFYEIKIFVIQTAEKRYKREYDIEKHGAKQNLEKLSDIEEKLLQEGFTLQNKI
jgi:hypothetical protein